jgi:hypothetical protein
MAERHLNRRQLVTTVGGVLGGGLAGVLLAGDEKPGSSPAPTEVKPAPATTPWAYHALDPEATGERGFAGYSKAHCMYGSFEAVVGQLGEKYGDPYKSFPFAMMKYGAGGVNGWATLCGSLNGGAAAIQLLSPDPNPLIDELFVWYDKEPLPDYVSKAAKYPNLPSVSGSPLCHVSISNWCAKTGKKSFAPERNERCALITASVARHVALLLNQQAAGTKVVSALPAEAAGCMSCHEKGSEREDARTKMTCPQCHFHLGTEHHKA